MTKEQIEKVESFITENMYKDGKIQLIATNRNDAGWFRDKVNQPKYLTSVLHTNAQGKSITHQLNSLKLLRDLESLEAKIKRATKD